MRKALQTYLLPLKETNTLLKPIMSAVPLGFILGPSLFVFTTLVVCVLTQLYFIF